MPCSLHISIEDSDKPPAFTFRAKNRVTGSLQTLTSAYQTTRSYVAEMCDADRVMELFILVYHVSNNSGSFPRIPYLYWNSM